MTLSLLPRTNFFIRLRGKFLRLLIGWRIASYSFILLLPLSANLYAACPNPCPCLPCPEPSKGDAITGHLNKTSVLEAECCHNPPSIQGAAEGVNKAELWAQHFGIEVEDAGDQDDLKEYDWAEGEICSCGTKSTLETSGDSVDVVWSGTVNLMEPGTYTLKATLKNIEVSTITMECPDGETTQSCETTVLDDEVELVATVEVYDVGCACDPHPVGSLSYDPYSYSTSTWCGEQKYAGTLIKNRTAIYKSYVESNCDQPVQRTVSTVLGIGATGDVGLFKDKLGLSFSVNKETSTEVTQECAESCMFAMMKIYQMYEDVNFSGTETIPSCFGEDDIHSFNITMHYWTTQTKTQCCYSPDSEECL